MTRASWDLLSILLYGRPGQELPPYVVSRAAEIDVYLRDMRLPASSPVVLAHAEAIIAIYKQEQRDAQAWESAQKALNSISGRLDSIERRLWPPKQQPTPQAPTQTQPRRPASAQAQPRPQAPTEKKSGLWQYVKNLFS